jgi:hypothetical protein
MQQLASKPFFLNIPSCCAMNMPLCAPVTAVQLIRTGICARPKR